MYTSYNINQFKLDISLDYMPEKHPITHFINGLVDSLEIHPPYECGRPREYSLAAVLKLLLFAHTRGVFTSRKINVLVQENMPAHWLTQDGLPSASTICRRRRAPELQSILDKGFESLVDYLREHRLIDDQVSVDGTKLLADANKYSFVWKKNTIRFDENNQDKIKKLLSN
ncbi:transposase [Fundicoccus sp. Sow4_D5]|uniref:transposase n=1 Tax=Fundicoccus sp. Sow4_D5 TaxID=3438782 RepID=UPI003F9141A9